MARKKVIDKQFKLDAVQYRKNHPELTFEQVAKNLGISNSSIHRWCKQFSDTKVKNESKDENRDLFRGSGNFSSDDAKELARLKKENEHSKQPVNVLYEAIKEYIEETAGIKSVSLRAVTQILGVSGSGFKSWSNRKPSKSKRRKEDVKKEISVIHEESHEIYGAPKITEELKKKGHVISEKTVGNYMREMHIKAHYIKPWTRTTISKDFLNARLNLNIMN